MKAIEGPPYRAMIILFVHVLKVSDKLGQSVVIALDFILA